MLRAYATKDEFLDAILKKVDQGDNDGRINTALISGISSADDDLREDTRNNGAQVFHLKIGSWVIRDEDLPIFEAFSSMASAIAITLTSAGAAWPAIAAAISQIVNICWRLWRCGVRLSASQVDVYGFLKTRGPLSIEALATGLNDTGKRLSTSDVQSILESLREIELSSGQIIELAKRDAGDYWKAMNI